MRESLQSRANVGGREGVAGTSAVCSSCRLPRIIEPYTVWTFAKETIPGGQTYPLKLVRQRLSQFRRHLYQLCLPCDKGGNRFLLTSFAGLLLLGSLTIGGSLALRTAQTTTMLLGASSPVGICRCSGSSTASLLAQARAVQDGSHFAGPWKVRPVNGGRHERICGRYLPRRSIRHSSIPQGPPSGRWIGRRDHSIGRRV
jgi:hypothetical protein